MDLALIDDETLALSRKSRLPGEGFFLPDEPSSAEQVAESGTLTDHDTVIVADPDPDGLACVAIIRSVHPDAALLPAGPHELAESLDVVAEHARPELTVFVCDLAPDCATGVVESLDELSGAETSVIWFDHHRWDEATVSAVEATGVELLIGDSESECTADVAIRGLDTDIPAHLETLATVTRDHDLWIKEDPRSDDLADYSYWSDPEEYVKTVANHGVDLPTDVHELLAERRQEKEALIDLAVDRARMVSIGPYTVGVTYGRCSQNEVAEQLRGHGADAAIIVKPAGSASIRGSESFERCHEVAGRVNGGGHPRAAGCKPAIYDDMLDYAHHWVTEGAVAQRTILDAFETVVEDE